MENEAAAFDRCLKSAVGKLKRSVLSESQLRAKLAAAGHDDAVIAMVLDRLRGSGAVNDEALGRALVDELRRRKGAGPRMIEAKLMSKGLDEALIARLMEAVGQGDADDDARDSSDSGSGDPVDQAEALARQTLAGLRGQRPAQLRKLWSLLARRGYDEATIETALDRIPELRD